MNGKNEIIKIGFWKVDREDLETVKAEMEYYVKKYAVFAKRIQYVLDKWNSESEYTVEELLNDICEFINDCKVCPLRFNCEFVVEACEEVYNCETCPRLRLCVQNRVKGLIEYLKEENR
jgi:hypothetical protein